mgnify:CR=1 FL=1
MLLSVRAFRSIGALIFQFAIFDRAMATAERGFVVSAPTRYAGAYRQPDRSFPILPALWCTRSAQVFAIPRLRDLLLIQGRGNTAGAKERLCKCGEHDSLLWWVVIYFHTCGLRVEMRLRDKFIM